MFENLSDRLQNLMSNLRGKGKLTEKDIDTAMREIRLALLEADVNFKVVKSFVQKVKERALGADVMQSLTPGQMVVKIVNEELINLMSDNNQELKFSSKLPTVIMMVGLQGAGKTTQTGKLALLLKKKNKKPLLVAGDIYRPAAIEQLKVVGQKVEVPVFSLGKIDPVEIAKCGIEEAKKNGNDVVIIDTAGRLHIDDELMHELKAIKENVEVTETLLVVDSMTGQDAVNVAKSFNEQIDITGILMTKLDGDTRGGAALSIRAVTEKPIKFIGTGETMGDLEQFHPDRLVSRILGMGDVLSLIEKAEQALDKEKAKELEEKLRNQSFDFNDFLSQISQMRNMGPLEELLKMIPGVNAKALKGMNFDTKAIDRIEAIIRSMTNDEREKPNIIDNSRKKRIANGSGTNIGEVNKLLKQFDDTKKMMKKMGVMNKKMKKGKKRFPFF
ncbi:signal recognition particle protein [Helcococcus ovis]|uniref:Signal recognition particle protein n=1 Tax=Helcococcus ovis TaxID=72026 RepID=A0A4R9C5F2_9FIRM|nr:signal recognition particle protein [Helcococcus ovis]TFF64878.1 signal recognition particle protein [Helcococcus ovis]TFF67155.1 signal recognition particle protein [Helcococcus ovis]TFF67950.1 signal recognition particle protein [Helcococcus ovis]WNZ01905.1 signal recognition particle protein [Helcococcus ovis]